MLKFNNDNIFTGYLKQMLASFNLPKYRVYTKEQAKYNAEYGEAMAKWHKLKEEWDTLTKMIADFDNPELHLDYEKNMIYNKNKNAPEPGKTPEPDITWYDYCKQRAEAVKAEMDELQAMPPEKDVLISFPRNDIPQYADGEDAVAYYPKEMRYIPYIKDNMIQIYAPKISDEGEPIYSGNDWKECHFDFGIEHQPLHSKQLYHYTDSINYSFGIKIKNGTKNLKIQNNIYDSYTHEYLGDYLRFLRDYKQINLMPLYNCFSNRVCPKLYLKFKPNPGKSNYEAVFDTDDSNYKIYMVPVKLFKQYTIAIDCDSDVEMCCGLFGKYQETATKTYPEGTLDPFTDLAKNTYMCFGNMQFKRPELYTKTLTLTDFLSVKHESELSQKEGDLKLFIKLPIKNNSSIVILEGDYTAYTGAVYKNNLQTADFSEKSRIVLADMNSKVKKETEFYKTHDKFLARCFTLYNYLKKPFVEVVERRLDGVNNSAQVDQARAIIKEGFSKALRYYKFLNNISESESFTVINGIAPISNDTIALLSDYYYIIYGDDGISGQAGALKAAYSGLLTPDNDHVVPLTNATTINFEGNIEDLLNNLITPLQLLKINTGISYPFADRLIEYLVGNAIIPDDDIADNITRAKTVAENNSSPKVIEFTEPGLWDEVLRAIYYNYMNTQARTTSEPHDILGYVDRDVEQQYACTISENKYNPTARKMERVERRETISSINIYDEWEDK